MKCLVRTLEPPDREFGRHSDGLMNILRPRLVIVLVGMENYELTYPVGTLLILKLPTNILGNLQN